LSSRGGDSRVGAGAIVGESGVSVATGIEVTGDVTTACGAQAVTTMNATTINRQDNRLVNILFSFDFRLIREL
jgi:hypothetical protein